MNNKTILITGSTSGFGRELTKLLATNNSIIMLGRNIDLLTKFKEELETNNSNKVDYVVCNYNNYDDINKASSYIISNYNKIDLIIHNAGAVLNSNDDVLHPSLKINFLAPVLLNELLKNILLKSDNPTIFYTSSLSIPKSISIDNFTNSNSYGKIKAYGLSKLAFNLYLIDFGNKYNNIKLISFDPGIIYTNAVKATLPKYLKWIFPITRIVAKKPTTVALKALEVLNSNSIVTNISYFKLNKIKPHKNVIKNIDKADLITNYALDMLRSK